MITYVNQSEEFLSANEIQSALVAQKMQVYVCIYVQAGECSKHS